MLDSWTLAPWLILAFIAVLSRWPRPTEDKSIEIHISFAPNQSIVNDSHNEDGAQYDIDRTNDETGFDRWPASNN